MPKPKRYTRDYTVKDVLWRLRDQVQLRAVLAPVTGRYHCKEEIPRRVRSLQMRWRRTLNHLRNRGWAPVTTEGGRMKAAKGCPLTFLMVYGKPRACGLPNACPFCWARQTAKYWDVIDAAFFRDAVETPASPAHGHRAGRAIELDVDPAPPRRPRKVKAHGYKLVTRTRTFFVTPYVANEHGVKLDLLRDFYQARVTGRPVHFPAIPSFVRAAEVGEGMRAISRPGKRSGCFENITADIGPEKANWTVSIRQVWLVPSEADLPVITPQAGVTVVQRVQEDPWRTQVMKAVAQACRYPKAMTVKWKEGGPAFQLVTARQGLRLAAMFGSFRKKGGDA